MKPLLLLKTGSTFDEVITRQGDFDQLFLTALGDSSVSIDIVDARTDKLPALENYQAVLITGSHHMVTDREDWSEALLPYIREMAERKLPVLGICYGHQLLADALGGEAGYHPAGREVGTVAIELTEAGQQDPLLGQLPQAFYAHVTHSQSALRLPDNTVVLAHNSYEPHQAFRIGENIWGLQFHPEFTTEVCKVYLKQQQEPLEALGRDLEELIRQVCETPESTSLLKRFVDLA